MVDFQTFTDAHIHEHSPYRGMLDLANILDVLDIGVNDTKFVIEEWRQPSHTDVAVPVKSEAEHAAAVLTVPGWIVRPSSEERHSKRCPCDYHAPPAAMGFLFRAVRCASA